MKEEWKDIPEYEGLYQVSSFGRVERVRSVDRVVERSNGGIWKLNGKLISSSKSSNGYLKVDLYKEGKVKTFTIHRLVAMAFLGHIPDGMDIVVDHINGDKLNNRVDNLQLISQRENLSKDKVGSSKYTGVNWSKPHSKWRSYIYINGRNMHLGLFHNEKEAGEMYQSALKHIDKYNGNPKEFRDYLNSI